MQLSRPKLCRALWGGVALRDGGAADSFAAFAVAGRCEPVYCVHACDCIGGAVRGVGPGLLVTVFGAVFGGYFVLYPFDQMSITDLRGLLQILLFLLTGSIISAMMPPHVALGTAIGRRGASV